MILSFNSAPAARLLLVTVPMAAVVACVQPAPEPAPEGIAARAAEVIGALKLVRQEYANAVAPEGGTVVDAAEYAETELFAEQAEAKFRSLADPGEGGDAAQREAIAARLGGLRAAVARRAPHAEVVTLATATIALVEPLLGGAVPAQIRGVVLATARADQAIGAEALVDEYRVGVVSGPARAIFLREDGALVAAPPAAPGASYLAAVVRERRTKRALPAAEVTIEIAGAGGTRSVPLAELWGEFHQYGANVELPGDGPVTLTVQVSPPAYGRHGDMLTHFVTPARASFAAVVRAGALAFDARPLHPTDPDYAVGDDVMQAFAEAGSLHESGAYRIGVIVEGPEPIWTWRDGAPTLQAVGADATHHFEVVVLDRESGQLVPNAHVHVTFLAEGRAAGTAVLHPLLSAFSHYGETLALPARATAVRVRVDPPALGALDRPRLAEPTEIELPLPRPRGATT